MPISPPLRDNRRFALDSSAALVIIYVNADTGDDFNTGSTSGQAFRTNARVAQEIAKYSFLGGTIAISYAAGTTNDYDKLELGDAYSDNSLKGSSGELQFVQDPFFATVGFDPDGGDGGIHLDIPLSLDLNVKFSGFLVNFSTATSGLIVNRGRKVEIIASSNFDTQEVALSNNQEIVFGDGNIFSSAKIKITNCPNINLGFPFLTASYFELEKVTSGQINRINVQGNTNNERILKIKNCQNLFLFGTFSISAAATDVRAYEVIDCDRIDINFDFQGTNAAYTGAGIPLQVENSSSISINGTSNFQYTGITNSIEIDRLSSVRTDDSTFGFLPYSGAPDIADVSKPGVKRFANNIVVDDQGVDSGAIPPYGISIQDRAGVGYNYLEVLTDRTGSSFGGADRGAFFGMEDNANSLADQQLAIYNYQGGPIVFYAEPVASGGIVRFVIENNGVLDVGNTPNYESLIGADDDIPNIRYIKDLLNIDQQISQSVIGDPNYVEALPDGVPTPSAWFSIPLMTVTLQNTAIVNYRVIYRLVATSGDNSETVEFGLFINGTLSTIIPSEPYRFDQGNDDSSINRPLLLENAPIGATIDLRVRNITNGVTTFTAKNRYFEATQLIPTF